MERTIIPGQLYRHFKNKLYQIITVARHSETGEELVIYQALYGDYKTYARPKDMFLSEVDHEKYPDVLQKYRFELVTKIDSETKQEETIIHVEQPEEESACTHADTHQVDQNEASAEIPNQYLMEFLDANSAEEKLEILTDAKEKLDETTIHSMALSLDFTLSEGSREMKINSLMQCLETMIKYECRRLR